MDQRPSDDDLGLTADERDAVAAATAFARDVVAPAASTWELDRRLPRAAVIDAARAGLAGLLAPRHHGGRDFGPVALARVVEEVAAADLAFAFVLVVHNNLVGAIARRGRPHHHDALLGPLVRGERLGAFLLTEPRGGSDAARITTTATPLGDTAGGRWVLEGEKAWVTGASHADVLSVYAQADPDRRPRASGIAAFLVPADRAGVERLRPYELLGAHAMGTGGFRFRDVDLGPDDLFVPCGEGFRAAMEGIDAARAVVAAMCAGMLATALDLAVAHTRGRPAFGATIADQQGVQWILADVATDLVAARRLAYDAAHAVQAGDRGATVMAAHAKKFATRAALAGLAQCMQVMGADGLRHDRPLARHLAGAKIAGYLDGATEIQNVVIARSLFAGT